MQNVRQESNKSPKVSCFFPSFKLNEMKKLSLKKYRLEKGVKNFFK